VTVGQPKILICCPVHSRKAYCIERWVKHVRSLSYPNFDLYLVDNSDTPAFSFWVMENLGVECDYFQAPKGMRSVARMAVCNEACRKRAIDGNYDYMLSLECDIFPPLDIIEQLLAHNVPAVSAAYFIGEGEGQFPVRAAIEKSFGTTTNRHVSGLESYLNTTGLLEPVEQNGIGCLLLHRDLFGFAYYTVKDSPSHADSHFHWALQQAGVQVYLDTSIICEHDNRSWSTVTDHVGNKF
jgi:hypothetical protein